MTKKIEETLNLPPLDEVLKKQGIDVHEHAQEEPPEVTDEQIQQTVTALHDLTTKIAIIEGTDHSEAMDGLHTEIVQHARDLMTYGYNIDMPRQRGIFEIAMIAYGHAMNAKNLKRDAQLKGLKLALDRRKVDLEERRTDHAINQGTQTATIEGNTIVVEDRNELIRQLREQIKKTG